MALFSKLETENVSREKSIAANQAIYFVGDLHLGDGSARDAFQKKDAKLMDFIKMVRMENAHLVLLGNAMDFAQAWSINRVIKAHARLLRELSEFAEEGGVTYVWGDYDTEISLYRDLLRFDTCSHLKIGDSIIAKNGWQYTSTVRKKPTESSGLKVIERLLNTHFGLPLENHYTIENRLRFAAKYAKYKLLSFYAKPDATHELNQFIQQQLCDPENLFQGLSEALDDLDCRYLITARSAMPGQIRISDKLHYVNAGSWIHGSAQYAKWDGSSFSVFEFGSEKRYGDDAYIALRDRTYSHMDFDAWWKENHMGWLRFRCAEADPVDENIIIQKESATTPNDPEEGPDIVEHQEEATRPVAEASKPPKGLNVEMKKKTDPKPAKNRNGLKRGLDTKKALGKLRNNAKKRAVAKSLSLKGKKRQRRLFLGRKSRIRVSSHNRTNKGRIMSKHNRFGNNKLKRVRQ